MAKTQKDRPDRPAGGPWDKIEKLFEDRVSSALRSLGVPSRDELDALRREIEALKAAMPGAPAKPAAKAAKTARRPARTAGPRS